MYKHNCDEVELQLWSLEMSLESVDTLLKTLDWICNLMEYTEETNPQIIARIQQAISYYKESVSELR